MTYDENNIFAKILRGEISCKKIYEDECVLSFYDINPQKKIHALVIPKGEYVDLDDFNARASDKEIVGLLKGISVVAKKLGISADTGKGYRVLSNLIGLIKNSSYVISNDTGPAHIAAHLNKKGLVLFGSHTTAKKVSIETKNFQSIQVKNLNKLYVSSVLEKVKENLN